MGMANDVVNGRDSPLQVYLLGTVDFDALLRLQRRLHYEISGDRGQAALILCEHPPLITVGRHGSRAHILPSPGAGTCAAGASAGSIAPAAAGCTSRAKFRAYTPFCRSTAWT